MVKHLGCFQGFDFELLLLLLMSIYLHLLKRQRLGGGVVGPSAHSLPKALQQPQPGQAKARSPELHQVSLMYCSGLST